ncbi:MAG: N-acetylmuramoyl-L-alanine amidase [Armatimonadetes bacterium]|nr:N-acetylmuramoyl-L-alanine amidase [Armatimonadota bacterium]
MINPSCQYANQIFDKAGGEIYNEGHNLWLFAEAVEKALRADGRTEPYISRESQTSASDLDSEAALTNALGCACLVALHSDATADGTPGGGTWTFYTGEQHLSAEELESLPYDLKDSLRLAELVQRRTVQAIQPVYKDLLDRGVRQHWHRLRMLHAPQCPSCLIEILFHSNPVEREMLKDPALQTAVGSAIAGAILEFLFRT